jgi:hypothetical protein
MSNKRVQINVSRLKESYRVRPGVMIAVDELEVNLDMSAKQTHHHLSQNNIPQPTKDA